jgi:DNA modification methylase
VERVSTQAIPKHDLPGHIDLGRFVPEELRGLGDLQAAIPEVAKNEAFLTLIERAVKEIPTRHVLVHGDARTMSTEKVGKAHLILTSPPYWTLKKYRDSSGQLGHIIDYDDFIEELDRVWQRCFDSLVVGGRLVCVVGDVCLSRRQNEGRHTVVPLHATIQEHCRKIGFDNLSPIIWHKIANAAYEVENGGAS